MSEDSHPSYDQFTGAPIREHAFDGIQEYDNNLPLWWQITLYISIVFACCYVVWYHFGPGQLGPERLAAEVAIVEREKAEKLAQQGELTEEVLRGLLTDQARIAEGEALYQRQGCQACHGADALGLAGPNLRDDQWKWGSNMMDIYTTLEKGRNNNAMPLQAIPRAELMALTIYVAHLNKTSKANGQGVTIEGEQSQPITY